MRNISGRGIRIAVIWSLFWGMGYAAEPSLDSSPENLSKAPPLPESVSTPEQAENKPVEDKPSDSTRKNSDSPVSSLKKNYGARIVDSVRYRSTPKASSKKETRDTAASQRSRTVVKKKDAVIPSEKLLHLYFPAEAIVEKQTYALNEIARIEGEDLILVEKLGDVEIGRSPLPGSSLIATRALILSRLRPFIPSEQIVFPGTDQVKLQRAALMVPGKEIDQAVLDHINEQYPDTEIKPKLLSRSRDIYLPKGEMTFSIQEKRKHKKEGGYRTYNVDFYIDEKLEKTFPVRTYLKVYKEIYVAKDTIKENQLIRDADLQKERRNIDQLPSAYITDKKEVVGKLAKRAINPNEVLKENTLERPPLIKKGEQLLIVFETPSLRLTAQGVAMAKGSLGERIPVRNVESDTIVYARVRSKTQVHVN